MPAIQGRFAVEPSSLLAQSKRSHRSSYYEPLEASLSKQIEKHKRFRAVPIACMACVLAISIPRPSVAQEAVPRELTLVQAIEFALRNSPTLRASRAEISAARAETGAARARQRPQISANGFLSQGNMPNILQSPMGAEPEALALSPSRSFADANFMLMAPLYNGFLSGLVAVSAAREQAVIAEATGATAEVAFRIREAYLQSLLAAELVKANQSRITAAEEMVRIARAQLEAGKGIEANVKRAEAELAEARQELTTTDNDRRKMVLDLLAEMGAALDASPVLTEALLFKPLDATLQTFLDQARDRRGELVAAKHRVRVAQGQFSAVEGTLRPQVYGFAMGDVFAPSDAMGNRSGYTVGLTVGIPILDGGMRRSEAAAARSMVEKARAEADRIELQVAKEVRQAWLDIETAGQNYQTAIAALAAAQAAYDVMAIRVESGKSIQLEQLDALATLTRAKANVARAVYEHQLAIARLNRAAGDVINLSGGSSK